MPRYSEAQLGLMTTDSHEEWKLKKLELCDDLKRQISRVVSRSRAEIGLASKFPLPQSILKLRKLNVINT